MMQWEKEKVARELDAMNNLIDYVLHDYCGDCCSKCVYCKEDTENDLPPCEVFEQYGSSGCKKGMLEWFSKEK